LVAARNCPSKTNSPSARQHVFDGLLAQIVYEGDGGRPPLAVESQRNSVPDLDAGLEAQVWSRPGLSANRPHK
jgi:hypothetical protein